MAHLARHELVDEIASGNEGGMAVWRLVHAIVHDTAFNVLTDVGSIRESSTSDDCVGDRVNTASRGECDESYSATGILPWR